MSISKMKIGRFTKTEFLFFVILFIIFTQQVPYLNASVYSFLRNILYILLSVSILFSLRKFRMKSSNAFLILFSFVVVYSIIIGVLAYGTNSSFGIINFVIPFGIFIYSYANSVNRQKLRIYLRTYVFLCVLLSLSIILYSGTGFTITTTYFLPTKNQVGPLIGYGAIISIFILFFPSKLGFRTSKVRSLLYLSLYLFLILTILIIRNRSGFLALFLVTSILSVIRLLKVRKVMYIGILIGICLTTLFGLFVFGYLGEIFNFVYDALFLNYDISDLNSISAGRIKGYIEGIYYIKDNYLLGEITGPILNYTPHNYVINLITEIGVFLSIPIMIFYVVLWIAVLKGLMISKLRNSSFLLLCGILLLALIISVFEYTYPYGPGVAQFMLWYLYGNQNRSLNEVGNYE